MQIGARTFLIVQLDQDILPHRFLKQVLMLAIGAVAPKDIFRLGQKLHFMHPIEHGLVSRLVVTDSRRRRNCGREVFHEYDVDPGGIERNMNFCRFARFSKNFLRVDRLVLKTMLEKSRASAHFL